MPCDPGAPHEARAHHLAAASASRWSALVAWVASNTYWADIKVPMPPKGEALTNPFYAVQRFAEALGARTAWDRVLTVPPTDSVIVLSVVALEPERGPARRARALGRVGRPSGRRRDAGWRRRTSSSAGRASSLEYRGTERRGCESADSEREERVPHVPGGTARDALQRVADDELFDVRSRRRVVPHERRGTRCGPSAIASGIQAMRVQVGRGSVTVINATPFRDRRLFDGDHGRLFVAATADAAR